MKDDEKNKDAGLGPSGEPTDEPEQLDRSAFLKALGVGVGAIGLGIVTGTHVAARTAAELDESRTGIQKLVRGLLENPSKAGEFLDSPQAVAEEFGVRVSDADAKKIQETLIKLAKEVGTGATGGHQDWSHQDGTWNDWYDKKVEKGGKGKTPPVRTTPPTTAPPTKKKQ